MSSTLLKVLFCLALHSISMITLAQQENIPFCGSENNEENDLWLKELQQNIESFKDLRNNNQKIYIPLTVHNVGTSDGQNFFSVDNIYRAICDMNRQFESVNIEFFIQGEIRFHSNTTWFNHATRAVGNAMYQATRVPNTINCYIDSNAAGACGYATLGGDRMFLRQSCIGANSATWAHEMGHSLTLPHTFRGWEGTTVDPTRPAPNFVGNRQVERVDRSNCSVSGDGFCDTDPDYISDRWSCNNNNESNLLLDPDSVSFRANGTFIMGYANDRCMTTFSDEQITAMRVHTFAQKAAMVNLEFPFPNQLESSTTNLLFPEVDQVIDSKEIEFSWSKVNGAEGYSVQVSRFASMAIMLHNIVVEDTSVVLGGFDFGRNYFFRVRPLNEHSYCQEFGELRRFRVDEIATSTNEISGASIRLRPNILHSGQHLILDLDLDRAFDATAQIFDQHGKLVQSFPLQFHSGQYQKFIPTHNLKPSLYFLHVTTMSEVHTSKFIIH